MEYFAYAMALLPFALAVGFGLIFPALLVWSFSNFTAGLCLVFSAAMLDNIMQAQPILRVGLTIFPADLPMLLVAMAAAMRWLLQKDVPSANRAWIVVVIVFAISLVAGLLRNGTGAGVQARPEFYAISAASYAMSFRITELQVRRLLQALICLAVATVLLSCYRWTVFYLPIKELLPPGGVYNNDGEVRVVASNYALVVAQVLVISFFYYREQASLKATRVLTPVLLATVLVLQHRSVWLAGIVGVLTCLLLAKTQRTSVLQQLSLLAVVVATAVSPLLVSDKLSEGVQRSAVAAVTGQGTVGARFSNWQATLEKWAGNGPLAIAIGNERGGDTTRVVEGEQGKMIKIQFHAHNHFVNTLTSLGLIGLIATLMVVFRAATRLWDHCRSGRDDASMSAILLVLLFAQITYYVAYGVDFVQYFILGFILSWRRPNPAVGSQIPRSRASSNLIFGSGRA